MRQKKNSKIILIIILLLVILILLTGGAYAYFATDIFKSNKELFFKYVTQIGEEDIQLKQYLEKQKNTPYQNYGKITADTNTADINNLNVTFDGEVNVASSTLIQNISLNYSDSVNFPLTYKKIEDTIGIQTMYIGSKFVATKESENLLGDEANSLKKIEEFSNVSFDEENKQHIKDIYTNILNQELQDSNFSKIEEIDSKGYRLTLSGESLKSLMVKVLETFKTDQLTLDKINEYLKIQKNSSKITISNIDNLIREINNNSELNDKTLEITVYQTKGKTTNLTIKLDEIEIELGKIKTENESQYKIALQINSNNNQTGKIELILKFVGLQSMQNVTEDHQLVLELDNKKYEYYYNNNIQFVDNVNIEGFNNNNSLMLNEAEEEQRNQFVNAVIERIQAVNQNQMEELGLEENENPLQYVIPQFGNYLKTSNVNEEEVNTFNQKFENYESTNLQGVTVKGLLSTIQLNNEAQEDEDRKIKEIHFDGEEYQVTDQNILLLKGMVETQESYRVEFEKDEETGMIYRAVINKK